MVIERLLILVSAAILMWLVIRYVFAPIIAKIIVISSRIVAAKVDKVEIIARVKAANDELDAIRHQADLDIVEQETIDWLTGTNQRRDK